MSSPLQSYKIVSYAHFFGLHHKKRILKGWFELDIRFSMKPSTKDYEKNHMGFKQPPHEKVLRYKSSRIRTQFL
jgi:hypothetical protein